MVKIKTGRPRKYKTVEDKLLANITKTDLCWTWNKSKNSKGYGLVWFGLKPYLAHRLSYVMNYGAIPDKLLVCHRCDNPSCVRPDHLFLGTHKDNTRDMIAKGRSPCIGLSSPINGFKKGNIYEFKPGNPGMFKKGNKFACLKRGIKHKKRTEAVVSSPSPNVI